MKKFLKCFVAVVVVVGLMVPVGVKADTDDVVEDEEILDDVIDDEVVEITINEKIPELYIKAVNPGYTVDGESNTGEMIEIARKDLSGAPISLAGTMLGYTNSSGNESILFEFPENSWMIGETILLRLASSPGGELASVNYTKTLAMKAGLSLKQGEEVIDEVCWTSGEGCYKEFKSSMPTTLVRNLETGEFEHMEEYEPMYDAESYLVEQAKEEEGYGALPSQCKGLVFSEILSYYETVKSEQFIEVYNSGSEQVLLDGCQIRYRNKNYVLQGVVEAEGYFAYYPVGFNLTKNPANANTLELVDTDGAILDTLIYPNGQRKGTAYAMIGYGADGQEIWKVTYAPTPGEPNNYQEFRMCEVGKVINEATGNCVKATEVKATVCKKGYYLNPATGRCKKTETKKEKTCKEGYYLNLETGRCKKNETQKERTCKEGYYLNPETNRCKKIVENKGADYKVEPEEYEESSSFVGLYAVLGVMGVGVAYLGYEFRREIVRLFGRVFRPFR